MGGILHVAKWGFPHTLRPLTLLRCSIAILSLVAGLVPPCALAAGAGMTPGGGGGAGAYPGNEAEGTDWRKKNRGKGAIEANWDGIGFSRSQDGRALLAGSLAGAAVPGRRGSKKHRIVLAASVAIVLAILGAAAHHFGGLAGLKRRSGNLAERINELVTLETEATGLAEAVVAPDSKAPLQSFKESVASAKQAGAKAAASLAAKEAPQQQQQQKDIDVHLADSTSSSRLLLKSALEKAQAMTNEAKAVVQRSASRAHVRKAELEVLNDEVSEAYLITREALERSIPVHARIAEKYMKNLEELPLLEGEADGHHLMSQARDYTYFIDLKAKSCAVAEELMYQLDTCLVRAHKQYHVNKELNFYLEIGKLHAIMEAHKAIALQAVARKDSGLSSEVVHSLDELLKAVHDLEEQFEKVSESYSVLKLSDSTAKTSEASASMTAEAAKFMNFHEACLLKLKPIQPFFDSEDIPCLEGSKVLKVSMNSALLECEVAYDHMQKMFKVVREETQTLLDGTVGGFKRPLVSAEIIQRVMEKMEAVQQSFVNVVYEIRAAVEESVGKPFKDDLEALERVHKARANMASLSKEAAECSTFFKMLTSLELDVEFSTTAYKKGEQRLKSEGIVPHSEGIMDLLEQFQAGMNAAKKAATLPDVAKAANALRTLADKLLTAIHGQTQD
ncbi:hypothetical protein Emag_002347 [Eimeria magna]